MPTIPTLTVTQEQADRVLAAFGTVNAYKQWLAGEIRDYVRTQERLTLMETKRNETKAGLAAIDSSDPLAGA